MMTKQMAIEELDDYVADPHKETLSSECVHVARNALETVVEFETEGITFQSAIDMICDFASAESEIEKLNERVSIMTRLLKGEWVETEDVCNALEMTFTEAFPLFDFSRTADWWSVVGKTEEERAREGQCVKTMFRIKKSQLERFETVGSVSEFETLKRHYAPTTATLISDGDWDGQPVYDTYECPACGATYELDSEEYEFCPKCGKHMVISKLTESEGVNE